MRVEEKGKRLFMRILSLGYSSYRVWKELNKMGMSTTYQAVLNWSRGKHGPCEERSMALQSIYLKILDERAIDPFEFNLKALAEENRKDQVEAGQYEI